MCTGDPCAGEACISDACTSPGCAGGSSWFTTTFPDVQPQIAVTLTLETLLGLTDDPATLDGYGPVPAALARDLATTGIWRCLVVDGVHGTVLGVGKNTHTLGYTPGAALTSFLRYAAPTCTIPGCAARSGRPASAMSVRYAVGTIG
jgi:hypothetical protein